VLKFWMAVSPIRHHLSVIKHSFSGSVSASVCRWQAEGQNPIPLLNSESYVGVRPIDVPTLGIGSPASCIVSQDLFLYFWLASWRQAPWHWTSVCKRCVSWHPDACFCFFRNSVSDSGRSTLQRSASFWQRRIIWRVLGWVMLVQIVSGYFRLN
jgi:hypothetical protein